MWGRLVLEDYDPSEICSVHSHPHNTQSLSSQAHSERRLISKLLQTKLNNTNNTPLFQLLPGQQASLSVLRQRRTNPGGQHSCLMRREGTPNIPKSSGHQNVGNWILAHFMKLCLQQQPNKARAMELAHLHELIYFFSDGWIKSEFVAS